MSALRTSDVIARVVAWHNRHPLARRIAAADVHSAGVVALPFALPEPPGADPALTPIFGGDWIYAADPGPLGEWVRRHGRYPLPECADWPHRQVDADLPRAHAADAAGLEGRTLRHVLTAVVERDGHRVRVLLAPQAPLARAAVFGRRLPSPRRAGLLAGGGLAALAGAGALAWWDAGPAPARPGVAAPVLAQPASAASALAAAPAAPAASAAPVASPATASATAGAASAASAVPVARAASAAPAVALAVPAASGPLHARTAAGPVAAAASAPAAAAPVAVAASGPVARPVDVDPVLRPRAPGTPPLVQIRPRLTEDEQRQARLDAVAARPAASAPHGTVWAIATLPLRTRDDALAQQALLQGLRAHSPTPMPTELAVMAAQGRWRVVWFPHPQQPQAEALLAQARARGLKVELIAF